MAASSGRRACRHLLSAAERRPEGQCSEHDLPAGPSDEEWRRRFAAVAQVLGDWDAYRTTMATAGEEAGEAVRAQLADDLVDTWRDLKEGLARSTPA